MGFLPWRDPDTGELLQLDYGDRVPTRDEIPYLIEVARKKKQDAVDALDPIGAARRSIQETTDEKLKTPEGQLFSKVALEPIEPLVHAGEWYAEHRSNPLVRGAGALAIVPEAVAGLSEGAARVGAASTGEDLTDAAKNFFAPPEDPAIAEGTKAGIVSAASIPTPLDVALLTTGAGGLLRGEAGAFMRGGMRALSAADTLAGGVQAARAEGPGELFGGLARMAGGAAGVALPDVPAPHVASQLDEALPGRVGSLTPREFADELAVHDFMQGAADEAVSPGLQLPPGTPPEIIRQHNMVQQFVDRVKANAAETLQNPTIRDMTAVPDARTFYDEKTNTIHYNVADVARDPEAILHEIAHASGVHEFGGVTPEGNAYIRTGGEGVAEIPPAWTEHTVPAGAARAGVTPEEHAFQTAFDSLRRHPDIAGNVAALRENIGQPIRDFGLGNVEDIPLRPRGTDLPDQPRTWGDLDAWRQTQRDLGFTDDEIENAITQAQAAGIDPTMSDTLHSLDDHMTALEAARAEGEPGGPSGVQSSSMEGGPAPITEAPLAIPPERNTGAMNGTVEAGATPTGRPRTPSDELGPVGPIEPEIVPEGEKKLFQVDRDAITLEEVRKKLDSPEVEARLKEVAANLYYDTSPATIEKLKQQWLTPGQIDATKRQLFGGTVEELNDALDALEELSAAKTRRVSPERGLSAGDELGPAEPIEPNRRETQAWAELTSRKPPNVKVVPSMAGGEKIQFSGKQTYGTHLKLNSLEQLAEMRNDVNSLGFADDVKFDSQPFMGSDAPAMTKGEILDVIDQEIRGRLNPQRGLPAGDELESFRVGEKKGNAGTFYGSNVSEVTTKGEPSGRYGVKLPRSGEKVRTIETPGVEGTAADAPLADWYASQGRKLDELASSTPGDTAWQDDILGAIQLKREGVDVVHFTDPKTGKSVSVDLRGHTEADLLDALKRLNEPEVTTPPATPALEGQAPPKSFAEFMSQKFGDKPTTARERAIARAEWNRVRDERRIMKLAERAGIPPDKLKATLEGMPKPSDEASNLPAWRRAVAPVIDNMGHVHPWLKEQFNAYVDAAERPAAKLIADSYRIKHALSSTEQREVVEILDGRKAFNEASSPKVKQAAGHYRQMLDSVWNDAVASNVVKGPRRQNYFPHKFAEGWDDNLLRMPQLDKNWNLRDPHLEKARTTKRGDYRRDLGVLDEYFTSAYRRIAEVQHFGKRLEVLRRFLRRMPMNKATSDWLHTNIRRVMGREAPGSFDIISGHARHLQALSDLGLAAFYQPIQGVNTSLYAGFGRSARALVRIARDYPNEVYDAMRSGALTPSITQEIIQGAYGASEGIRSPRLQKFMFGIPTIDKWTRIHANTAGKLLVEDALKGNKGAIKDIETLMGKGYDFKGTDAYDQVGKALSDKALFRTGTLEVPGWSSSAAGKLATQYSRFMYRHSLFVKDIFGQAAKGNVKPLARFLVAAGTVIPGMAEALYPLREGLRETIKEGVKGEFDPEKIGREGIGDPRSWNTEVQWEDVLRNKRIPWTHPMKRYLQNLTLWGGLGVFQIMIERASRGGGAFERGARATVGPVPANIMELLGSVPPDIGRVNEGEWPRYVPRWMLQQIPIAGYPIASEVFPPVGSYSRHRRSRGRRR